MLGSAEAGAAEPAMAALASLQGEQPWDSAGVLAGIRDPLALQVLPLQVRVLQRKPIVHVDTAPSP